MKKKSGMSIVDHIRIARSKVPQQSAVQTATLDSRVSLAPEPGTRKAKRVRFEEPDTQRPLTCEPNACLRNSSANVSPTSGNPKTSEYAFYKKFREDAHSSQLYNRHKQQKQLEESEARNYTKEIAKPKYEIRSISAIEKQTPTALVPTISPGVSLNTGSECKHKDIFSIKREKLIHLAAGSLSLDMDTVCSKGYDLVPMLLQRLHPDNSAIAETSCSRSRSESVDTQINNNSQLHVSLDSAIHVKEIPWSPGVNLVSPFAREKSESSLLCSWSDTPKESSFPQEVGEDWVSISTWCPSKIFLKCERTHLEDIMDCSEPSSLYAKVDSDFRMKLGAKFHVNEDDCLALDYMPNQPSLLCPTFRNLSSNTELSDMSFTLNSSLSFKWSESDGLPSPTVLTSLSKQRSQLPSWSPHTVEKEEYLSSSCRGAELNPSLPWRTTSEDYLQSPNSIFMSRSIQSILQCSDLSLRNISPRIYHTYTVRSHDLSEEGSIVTWHPNEITFQRERTHLDDIVDCSEPSNSYSMVDSDFSIKPGAEFPVNEEGCLALDYMPDQPSLFSPTLRSLSPNSGLSSDKSLMLNSSSSFKWRYVLSSPNIRASLGKQQNQLLSWSPHAVEKEEYFSNSSRGSLSEDNLHSTPNSIFSPSVRSICHSSDLTLGNMSSGKYLTDIIGLQTPDVSWHDPNSMFSSSGMNRPHVGSISQCSDLTSMNMSAGNYLTDSVESRTPDVGNYQVEDPSCYYPLRLCCGTPKFLGFTC